MNYAVAAIAVVLGFAGVYWILFARHQYTSPEMVLEGLVADGQPEAGEIARKTNNANTTERKLMKPNGNGLH
ncbi:hypothetical protein AtubIFM57258_000778 [Aspergillus tubingensis]|nr:hypothetical protein AtubIFM57258_000778 [Aspergillus tubingensis]